jgi:hypothetical protein
VAGVYSFSYVLATASGKPVELWGYCSWKSPSEAPSAFVEVIPK